jgi:hypothetical protein
MVRRQLDVYGADVFIQTVQRRFVVADPGAPSPNTAI